MILYRPRGFQAAPQYHPLDPPQQMPPWLVAISDFNYIHASIDTPISKLGQARTRPSPSSPSSSSSSASSWSSSSSHRFHLEKWRKHTQNTWTPGPPTSTPWFPWVDHTCRRFFHSHKSSMPQYQVIQSPGALRTPSDYPINNIILSIVFYMIKSKTPYAVTNCKTHTQVTRGEFIGAPNMSTISLHSQSFFCATAVFSYGHQILKRGWLWIQVQTAICRLCRCPF